MTKQADDAILKAREELKLLEEITNVLETVSSQEGRARVLAAVCAQLGHYKLAHQALEAAERWKKEEEREDGQ